MNNIGSHFYKDMSKYDIANNRIRRKVMNASILLAITVGAIMSYFKLPDLLMYISVGLLSTPGVIIGMKKDIDMKEKWQYKLKINERIYQTKEMENYTSNDFIQKKGISEVNITKASVVKKRKGFFKRK